MNTPTIESTINQGKPPASIVWKRKLSAWIDGAPISASKGTLRMSGDTIIHKATGDRQALRLGTGHILYRARGVSESSNPTNFQVAGDLVELPARCERRQGPGQWDSHTKQWSCPNRGSWTWDIPKNLNLCIPVPGILLTLSTVRPMSPDLVDLGTLLEWTRVQAIIKSRTKNIRTDGKLGHFVNNLATHSQDATCYWWTVDLAALNKVRALFKLNPLPAYESPIDGLGLADFKNLHSLAAS